jgi:hypothetical protein
MSAVAEPSGSGVIESMLETCKNCNQPIVSVKLEAGASWSDWAHAFSGSPNCDATLPPPGETPRAG